MILTRPRGFFFSVQPPNWRGSYSDQYTLRCTNFFRQKLAGKSINFTELRKKFLITGAVDHNEIHLIVYIDLASWEFFNFYYFCHRNITSSLFKAKILPSSQNGGDPSSTIPYMSAFEQEFSNLFKNAKEKMSPP